MKNFSEWNDVKITTDASIPEMKIREGEIRWCRIGINIGNEIIGKGESFIRPVLILKKFSGDVFLGAPLTTKSRTGNWYHPILLDGIDQIIILNQARLLDRKRLQDKMHEVSEKELDNIKRAYCNLILS